MSTFTEKLRPMRVLLVTGTREESRSGEARHLLGVLAYHLDLVIVGDCPTGIDREVRTCCQEMGIDYSVYPALWQARNKPAGPRRNTLMVTVAAMLQLAGAEVTWAAFPGPKSAGTKGTIGLLKAAELREEPGL